MLLERQSITDIRKAQIFRRYNLQEAEFILAELNDDELSVIDETERIRLEMEGKPIPENLIGLGIEHYFTIADVNFKMLELPDDMKQYDCCHVLNLEHYNQLQAPWLEEGRRLLKQRLRREPTIEEWFQDISWRNSCRRFRACYCIENPDKVVTRQ